MSHPEFLEWIQFHNETPLNDVHRYHRPAALVVQAIKGGHIDDHLRWLTPGLHVEDEVTDEDGLTAADRSVMRAFGFTRKGG